MLKEVVKLSKKKHFHQEKLVLTRICQSLFEEVTTFYNLSKKLLNSILKRRTK